ncbi:MAG: hydrogenase maturation nickel metallochaperone HypA [Lachnospiraceae bacterium]|nr:hydrogenase maturation nickel metallochaperone HypA [Lachnospiraceae bacterium]
MHELGVVFYIIRDVKEVAAQNNVAKVAEVTIELGEVSGVIPEYLTDCWDWACKKEPVMEGAKLNIETMEAITFCEDCRQEYPTMKYAKICPHCGSSNTYLLKGRDVNIKDITVMGDQQSGDDESSNEAKAQESGPSPFDTGLELGPIPEDDNKSEE